MSLNSSSKQQHRRSSPRLAAVPGCAALPGTEPALDRRPPDPLKSHCCWQRHVQQQQSHCCWYYAALPGLCPCTGTTELMTHVIKPVYTVCGGLQQTGSTSLICLGHCTPGLAITREQVM